MNLRTTEPRARIFSTTICCLAILPVLATAEEPASSTALTIYSTATPGAVPPELYRPSATNPYQADYQPDIPGYALVKQERNVDLAEKRSVIRFTDVASKIDPTTVSFTSLTDPTTTRVLEQSYEFDLVSQQKLMDKFIGQKITVERAVGDHVETITGTLLSAAGGLSLAMDDGCVMAMSGYSNIQYPSLPGGLITKPTLVWDVLTSKPGKQSVRVTYETTGVTWWADYNVVFAEGKDANSGTLDIGAWVSILNRSGATYPDAKLKLIAGDVHRAPKPSGVAGRAERKMRAMAMAEADESLGFEEKSFFEYHLYILGRPTTIPQNSTRQIEMFPAAKGVPCEKIMLYYGLSNYYPYYANPMTDRNYGIESNPKVDIYLKLKNDKDSGMGMPLPSGRIRVSKLDSSDGTLEFIGEDKIDHTPKDEKVLIKMGSAFDVVGERRQVDFRIDTGRKWIEEDFEIKVRNHKTEPVKVIVKENCYRWANWNIIKKSHEFEKQDSRTIHFPIEVAKDGETIVTYTVKYTW